MDESENISGSYKGKIINGKLKLLDEFQIITNPEEVKKYISNQTVLEKYFGINNKATLGVLLSDFSKHPCACLVCFKGGDSIPRTQGCLPDYKKEDLEVQVWINLEVIGQETDNYLILRGVKKFSNLKNDGIYSGLAFWQKKFEKEDPLVTATAEEFLKTVELNKDNSRFEIRTNYEAS